ncbi:MAG: hypothetical protein ROO71_11670 [Balneola sp.]
MIRVFFIATIFMTSSLYAQEIPEILQARYDKLEKQSESRKKQFRTQPQITEEMIRNVTIETIAALKSSYGANLDLMADQTTSTNNFRGFWDYAYEPRIEILNELDYSGAEAIRTIFDDFTNAELMTASYIHLIEDSSSTFIVEGKNLSESVRAGLYLLKGLVAGHTGLIYDQGYDIKAEKQYNLNVDFNDLGLSLVSSDEIIDSAISNIEKAITIVDAIPEEDFEWLFLETGVEVDKSNFKKIANSIIAKILINEPRFSDEEVDYAKILTHADEGLDSNFPNILIKALGNNFGLADYYSDWSSYIVSCTNNDINNDGCSGYFPTDVKVMHLLDDTYPTYYPLEDRMDYREAESSDPRLEYYKYTLGPGFLNGQRDPRLLSNYFSVRTYAENDWNNENYPIILMT